MPGPVAGGTLALAHRGDAREHPENTIAALLAALAIPGCDGVEFDVRAARDGTPVLAHDETLSRVFGRDIRVADMSVAELAALGVPTLREVLGTIPPRAFLDVEIKEDVGAAIVPLLRAFRGTDLSGAVVSSFDVEALQTVRAAAPSWPTWLGALRLDEHAIAVATRIGCRGVAADDVTIDADLVAMADTAGLEVAAWTVRSPRRLAELSRLGVVAVCVEEAALDGARAVRAGSEGDGP